MNLKNVWDSIVETGGASYNPFTGELNPETGYMVTGDKKYERKRKYYFPSIKDEEYEELIITTYEQFKYWAKNYLMDKWDLLHDGNLDDNKMYIGFWIHEGVLYMDLAENIQDFSEAYTKAFEREQIALYDCKNHRDIKITYMYPY